MRFAVLVLGLPAVLATGCGRIAFDAPADASLVVDAPQMAATDAPAECMMFPARHFNACALPSPLGGLQLTMPGTYVLDTTAGVLADPAGMFLPIASINLPAGHIVSVDSFFLGDGATLRAVGLRPLVIASFSSIVVDGLIDVSSNAANGPGAGANPPACMTHAAQNGLAENSGGGGGGGGGFGGAGGSGGQGQETPNAPGGAAVALPFLLGGCPGGDGGRSDLPLEGEGGAGGGAVQLTARISVVVAGSIHAGGAGGGPADDDAGGGGGGSGGMIGIEAPSIMIATTAVLAANGGGGGGGGETTIPGARGTDGQLSRNAAAGGIGGDMGDGGNGGNGSSATVRAGQGGGNSLQHGGGGGGGGAGYIVLGPGGISVSTTNLSPPQTSL